VSTDKNTAKIRRENFNLDQRTEFHENRCNRSKDGRPSAFKFNWYVPWSL